MKKLTPLVATIAALLLAGCYTEIGTVREETGDEEYTSENESYRDAQSESDTSSSGSGGRNWYYDDYDDRWSPRYRYFFSYYYPSWYWPSFRFSVAYGDPWYYSYHNPWYYSNWYYDPWICGTPYVVYGWPYYPVYYAHYSYPHGYHGVRYNGGGYAGWGGRTNRDFGSTRGRSTRTMSGRTGRGVYDVPAAGSVDRATGSAGRGYSVPSAGRTSVGRGDGVKQVGSSTPSEQRSGRRETTRGERKVDRQAREARGDGRYEIQLREPPHDKAQPARSNGSSRGEGRRVGSQRSGGSSAPAYSPPSSGSPSAGRSGGSSSGGGGRSGGRSGGRR